MSRMYRRGEEWKEWEDEMRWRNERGAEKEEEGVILCFCVQRCGPVIQFLFPHYISFLLRQPFSLCCFHLSKRHVPFTIHQPRSNNYMIPIVHREIEMILRSSWKTRRPVRLEYISPQFSLSSAKCSQKKGPTVFLLNLFVHNFGLVWRAQPTSGESLSL